MNKKKILKMRCREGGYGYKNTEAVIEAIFELDKTMKSLKQDLKEVTKQYKYMWQTLDEKRDANCVNSVPEDLE